MKKPTNLEECFQVLKEDLCTEDLNLLTEMREDQLARLHHTLGRWIRNNWDLWQGGPLSEYFNKLGLHHADDMSGVIIDSFWRHLHGKPLNIPQQVKVYQEYWNNLEQNDKQG
jgi:hypothetical protein